MTILPNNPAFSNFTGTYSRQESASVSLTSPQDGGASTVKLSASYSSTVSISGLSGSGATGRSQTFEPNGIAKYEAIGDAPRVKNAAAENILKFVTARIESDIADGASPEELESRLAAALEGFERGYQEAFEQLDASGLLSPEISDVVQQTYDMVSAGIEALAEKYNVASPVSNNATPNKAPSDLAQNASAVVAEPADEVAEATDVTLTPASPVAVGSLTASNTTSVENVFSNFANQAISPERDMSVLLKGVSLNYEMLESRDFNFTLKTQDGDDVTISASAFAASQGSANRENYASAEGSYQSTGLSAGSSFSSQFSFSVDGDLDEDELTAISDLLSQIADLSASFFSGDIQQAFEQALNIGFDSSEIANFSLNLQQQVSTKVEATYEQIERGPDTDLARKDLQESLAFAKGNNSLNRLANFVAMLQDLSAKTEALGIEKKMIPEFSEYLADTVFSDSANKEALTPFLENMLHRAPVA